LVGNSNCRVGQGQLLVLVAGASAVLGGDHSGRDGGSLFCDGRCAHVEVDGEDKDHDVLDEEEDDDEDNHHYCLLEGVDAPSTGGSVILHLEVISIMNLNRDDIHHPLAI
jgi:hypothetical protein